uniref:Uncharacterized protein n=1 Tax=uncultured Acidobacteria bacterium HF4000_26D02 TaxID=710731 RepID=E0XW71_9BACT|nr:hypothetical protein [uncultured Acidobacteria bacterium HF4000_26D02]
MAAGASKAAASSAASDAAPQSPETTVGAASLARLFLQPRYAGARHLSVVRDV